MVPFGFNRGEADGDGGIDVGAADAEDAVDGDRDGESPSGGDDDPSGVAALGLVEHDVCDDAVAEQHENQRAGKLRPKIFHGGFLPRL